ncbi:hypothetical protein BD769DRAFT_1398291 [Suillus cothurnatus]|nr:hypothetical protein BD769DRAFT_1398291 [Suillus cothurnatus]
MYNTVPIGSRVCGEDLWGEYTAIPDHATVPNGSRICGEEIPAHASVMCMYLNINTGMALTGDHTMCKYVLATDAAPFGDRTIWTVPDGIHLAVNGPQWEPRVWWGDSFRMGSAQECAVPNGSRICGDEITAHASVPNGGHVFGETNIIHGNPTLPQADESHVYVMVPNGSHVLCGEEILAERAILHATHICDEEMCADRAVPNGSRVCAVDDLHIVRSLLGATSVVGCATVPNGSRVCGEEMFPYYAVPSGSRICGEEQPAYAAVPMGAISVVNGFMLRVEMCADHPVPNGSHVCGKEISAHPTVPNGSRICGEEMLPWCAVPSGSRICGEDILAPMHHRCGSHWAPPGVLCTHFLITETGYMVDCLHLSA